MQPVRQDGLAVSLLEALPRGAAAAVKFTTTEDVFERCPRGTPCVVCDIDVPFRIVEDPAVLAEPGTDTDRLGRAGARRVVWAIAKQHAGRAAWRAARARMEGEDFVVMEGSTIVSLARPELNALRRASVPLPGALEADLGRSARAGRPRGREPARGRDPLAFDEVAGRARAASTGARLVVADVTRPAAEWAGSLLEGAPTLHA